MTTQQSEIDVLKAQVRTLDAALAKQSRTFKRMFYGFGCLVVAGIALAATSMQGPTSGNFTDLTCTSLTVNDGAIKIKEDGKLTTKLYTDSGGDGQVEIYNSAQYICAELYGDADGDGRLRIYQAGSDLDTTLAIDLYGSSRSGGTLEITDLYAGTAAVLSADPGEAQLILSNNEGLCAELRGYQMGGTLSLFRSSDGKETFSAP